MQILSIASSNRDATTDRNIGMILRSTMNTRTTVLILLRQIIRMHRLLYTKRIANAKAKVDTTRNDHHSADTNTHDDSHYHANACAIVKAHADDY